MPRVHHKINPKLNPKLLQGAGSRGQRLSLAVYEESLAAQSDSSKPTRKGVFFRHAVTCVACKNSAMCVAGTNTFSKVLFSKGTLSTLSTLCLITETLSRVKVKTKNVD
jgi:hypothetical protein